MSYDLFLDDERNPKDVKWVSFEGRNDFVVVRSYDEFVSCVKKNGIPDFVTFDHDLAIQHYAGDYSDEKTGYDCAKWLVDFCFETGKKFPIHRVHSMNPIGTENIGRYIANAKKVLGV